MLKALTRRDMGALMSTQHSTALWLNLSCRLNVLNGLNDWWAPVDLYDHFLDMRDVGCAGCLK